MHATLMEIYSSGINRSYEVFSHNVWAYYCTYLQSALFITTSGPCYKRHAARTTHMFIK